MSKGTRYVVFGGGGLVVAGLAIGLVAWLGGGLPALAQGHPDELRYLPADAAVISFANVRDVMNSDLRERLREREPDDGGAAALEDWSGIDLDTDIDRVAAAIVPGGQDSTDGIVVLVGRFDAERIESIAIARGGIGIDHAGRPLILLETDRDNPIGEDAALAFLEPGVLAIGSETLVRQALDEEAGADTNPRLMGASGARRRGEHGLDRRPYRRPSGRRGGARAAGVADVAGLGVRPRRPGERRRPRAAHR